MTPANVRHKIRRRRGELAKSGVAFLNYHGIARDLNLHDFSQAALRFSYCVGLTDLALSCTMPGRPNRGQWHKQPKDPNR